MTSFVPFSTVPPARLSTAQLPDLDLSVPPWPGRRLAVGGTQLFVRSTPGGPNAQPAVFVHGLGGASTNWTDLAAQLSPWLAVEAPDLPGFGRSTPPPDRDYSMTAHTRTVISYLERSGRGPVHLFGNSMGGVISILVAAKRPDLVRTLTLISPAVPDLRPRRLGTDPLLSLALLPGAAPLVSRRIRAFPAEERARAVIALCFADPRTVPEHRIAEAVADVRARDGMAWATEALIRSLRALVWSYLAPGARGLWARLASITAPTLVVWGRRDRLVSASLAPRVAATVPDARLLLLDGVGHVAQLERPVTTARAALALLEDARSVATPGSRTAR